MTAQSVRPESTMSILRTGMLGTALVLAVAALCIAPFDPQFFIDWVATAFMAATPAQIIISLLWHNSRPSFIAALPQPGKGLALTAVTVLVGALVLTAMLFLASGGRGITPMFVQLTILTVVVTLWLVPVWQCWPFIIMSKDPLKVGILTLVAAYLIAYGLWRLFFDYAILAQLGHPQYHASIEPSGMFDMLVAMAFAVTTAGVIVAHALFDFWPFDKLSFGRGQPARD